VNCYAAVAIAGSLGHHVDIVANRQGHYISFKAIHHCASLFTCSTVGLLNRHLLLMLLQPMFGKRLVELLVELAGWVVGYV
jgi:hypothetical protein